MNVVLIRGRFRGFWGPWIGIVCVVAISLPSIAQEAALHAKHRLAVFRVLATGRDFDGILFNEDTVAEVARWYEKGDCRALAALMDATKHGDGAVSEALGETLGEALMKHPRTVLIVASRRSPKDQRRIASAAVAADGGGFAPEDMKKIRLVLTRNSKDPDSAISVTAKRWLEELDAFEKANRE